MITADRKSHPLRHNTLCTHSRQAPLCAKPHQLLPSGRKPHLFGVRRDLIRVATNAHCLQFEFGSSHHSPHDASRSLRYSASPPQYASLRASSIAHKPCRMCVMPFILAARKVYAFHPSFPAPRPPLPRKLRGALHPARRPLLQPGCPLHQSPCCCSAHHALRKLSQSRADPFGRRLTLEALAWAAPS